MIRGGVSYLDAKDYIIKNNKYLLKDIEFTTENLLSCTDKNKYNSFIENNIPNLITSNINNCTFVHNDIYGISCQIGSCGGNSYNSQVYNSSTNIPNCVIFSFSSSKINKATISFIIPSYSSGRVSGLNLFAKNNLDDSISTIFSIIDGYNATGKPLQIYSQCITSYTHPQTTSEVTFNFDDFSCLPSGEYIYYFCSPQKSASFGNQPMYMSYLKLEFE